MVWQKQILALGRIYIDTDSVLYYSSPIIPYWMYCLH